MSAPQPGLIAVYRWRVSEEHEQAFLMKWRQATRDLSAHGGIRSLIGKTQDGLFAAVALWPDAHTRETAFAAVGSEGWPPAERLEPISIDPIENLWSHRKDQSA